MVSFKIDLNDAGNTLKNTSQHVELWYPFTELASLNTSSEIIGQWRVSNGLHILKNGALTIVHTDNFGTVPVLLDLKSKSLISDFGQLDPFNMSVAKLDLAGFWEGMIYDHPLCTRTMNKNIMQLTDGLRLEYHSNSDEWSTMRWNYFDVSRRCSEAELLKRIDERLNALCRAYWDALPEDSYILLPLSGGLDSRLLAIHLAMTGDPSRIRAMTFGFSKRSQEYRLAHRVCKELGISNHRFHQLPREHYGRCVDYFWRFWQGCVSVLHSHMYSFLREHPPGKALLVSGFFADPVAGYAAKSVLSSTQSLEASKAYNFFQTEIEEMRIDDTIANDILGDLRFLFDEWKQGNTAIDFDEYLYLTQRQSKTFCPLLQIYRNYCITAVPFADPSLVNFFLSAPFALRKEKLIMRKLVALRNHHLLNIGDVSSSVATHSLLYRVLAEWKKWCGRASVVLSWATGDRLRYVSSYSTEDIFGALRSEARQEILAVLNNLYRSGILTKHQYNVLKKKPLKSHELVRHARLLTFAPMFKTKFA